MVGRKIYPMHASLESREACKNIKIEGKAEIKLIYFHIIKYQAKHHQDA
jgi:hypothetical protein